MTADEMVVAIIRGVIVGLLVIMIGLAGHLAHVW